MDLIKHKIASGQKIESLLLLSHAFPVGQYKTQTARRQTGYGIDKTWIGPDQITDRIMDRITDRITEKGKQSFKGKNPKNKIKSFIAFDEVECKPYFDLWLFRVGLPVHSFRPEKTTFL